MCRNIRTLFNFEPPATQAEIRASAEQFVRKLSGCAKPARANEAAFTRAVDEVERVARELLRSMKSTRPPRQRDVEAAKARARAATRLARQGGFVPEQRSVDKGAPPLGSMCRKRRTEQML